MDLVCLPSLMYLRFKYNVILKNLGFHSAGRICLCREKILQIDGLLSKDEVKLAMKLIPSYETTRVSSTEL
jgi:hypothetical protein